MAETIFYSEKPKKIWAMTPKPEFVGKSLEVTSDTLQQALQICVIGLAHTQELAERRMKQAQEHPRRSANRLYQQSFVEAAYDAGPLAVVAFTAMNDQQPEEWVIEAFLGEAVEPEEHVLPMDYPTIWGVDVADQDNLNRHMDQWYPTA